MRAVTIEKCFPLVNIENDWVDPTALRSIIVDGATLTAVENASPRRILERSLSIPLGDEEILRKAKASYPYNI